MTGRRKLLLADDSPTIQKVISLTFADEGMDIVTASDGREALRLLGDERAPDIVLADAVMPGPDGYELCEHVKRDERLRHVPVVLLVGAFEPFNEAEARRVGADTVLTKPFQSIRDLVNKVGSLLGGEGKPEAEERGPAEHAEAGHRELAEEVLTRRADAPAEPPSRGAAAPAGDDSAFSRAAMPAREDESSPFGDLGADDELIEATPADSFGGAPAAPHAAASPFDDLDEPGGSVYQTRAAGAGFAAEARAADAPEEHVALPFYTDADTAAPFGGTRRDTPQASYNPAGAEEAARPAFAARAAGASAADDALLDLGQIEPPAAAAAEADEFILDLDDEFDAPPARASRAAAGSAGPLSFDDLDDAPVDTAGAFAEAAHGEAAPHFPETEAARAPFEFSALPAEAESHDPLLAREVVSQDVPPSFTSAAGGTAEADALATSYLGGRRGEDSAPAGGGAAVSQFGGAKEFIEPQVVPADEPVPGTVEASFTDGSVEGDVPRPPAFIPDAPAPPQPFVPAEPSPAGFKMGEARAGTEETLRPGQLSPETIEAIARRVVELMSEKVVREIAWEVVPDLAELLIKQRLDEERNR